MIKTSRIILAVGTMTLVPWTAWTAEQGGPGGVQAKLALENPIIESIEGDQIVVILSPDGTSRSGGARSEIRFGDRVKTGPRATARIRYPDGSRVLVGRSTEVEIQKYEKGTQWSQLHGGEIRGVIRKVPGSDNSPPRFGVRSRAVVMGVRGTDFTFSSGEKDASAEVRTLEGKVEVAPDEQTLMSGQGTSLESGQMVSADSKKGLSKVVEFDAEEYYRNIQDRQPGFLSVTSEEATRIQNGKADGAPRVAGPGGDEGDGGKTLDLPAQPEPKPPILSLNVFDFRLGGIYILQRRTQSNFLTFKVSWNPVLEAWKIIGIRGHFGFFPFRVRNALNTDPGLGMQAGLLGSLSLWRLNLEAGLGVEGWVKNHAKESPYAMVNVAWKTEAPKGVERFFVGASLFDRYPNGRNPAFELNAGLGVRW